MVAVFASAGWIVVILAFLSCGRTQPVVWCWWTCPGRQKASPRLRNVICNRKLAWCAYVLLSWKDDGFHSVQSILSLIGEKPGIERNQFQKCFWKILGGIRFVRLFLLYGQIGPDRKNMAIMQDLTSPLWKIAKMQDGIKWPNWPFGFGLRQNDRYQTDKRDSAQRRHVGKIKIAGWRSKLYCCWHHPSHSTVIHHKRAAAMLY